MYFFNYFTMSERPNLLHSDLKIKEFKKFLILDVFLTKSPIGKEITRQALVI